MTARPEQTLQIAVARFLRLALRAPTFWSSIDHGAGKMTRASAGLRKARGVKAGLPDILIIHRERLHNSLRAVVLGIELKAGKGSLSPAQKEMHDAFPDAGAFYFVAKSVEEVEGCLREVGIPIFGSVMARTAPEQAGAA